MFAIFHVAVSALSIPFFANRFAKAHSRVTPYRGQSICTFVLEAPPAPLEELEGALAEQSRILSEELSRLAARMATTCGVSSHE